MIPPRLAGPTEITQAGHRSAPPMPKAYCVAARPKMDLPPDALCRDTPVGGLRTSRGDMEWRMVPAPPGRTFERALRQKNTLRRLHQRTALAFQPLSHLAEDADYAVLNSSTDTAGNRPPPGKYQCNPQTSTASARRSSNPDTFFGLKHSIFSRHQSTEEATAIPRKMRPGTKAQAGRQSSNTE